jgi:hypothetical protein
MPEDLRTDSDVGQVADFVEAPFRWRAVSTLFSGRYDTESIAYPAEFVQRVFHRTIF